MIQSYSTPVETQEQAAPEAATPPAPMPESTDSAARSSATLNVSVPGDAKVYVNGSLTRSIGERRQYISRGLRPGSQYRYEVRAEVQRDGETVEETQVVQLRAGETNDLRFAFNDAVAPSTTLTLHVPETAKVLLSGRETNGTGDVRVFTTKRLAAGKTWSDYKIQVTVEQDGQTLTKEKTITLSAGDSQELTFDFDAAQVAAR